MIRITIIPKQQYIRLNWRIKFFMPIFMTVKNKYAIKNINIFMTTVINKHTNDFDVQES